jgi:copper(I)-binding protein
VALLAVRCSAGPAIAITEPYARASIPNGVIYLTLTNQGSGDDALLSAETEAARAAELHQTTIDEQGIMRMSHISRLPLPPGEPVVLEPGGLHLMLIGLQEGIVQGDTLHLTLNFEKAGPIMIEVPVQSSLAGEDAGHSHQ